MKSFRERNIKRLLYCQCFQIQLQRREVPNLCNKGTITFAKRLFYFLWTNTQLKSYSEFFSLQIRFLMILKILIQPKSRESRPMSTLSLQNWKVWWLTQSSNIVNSMDQRVCSKLQRIGNRDVFFLCQDPSLLCSFEKQTTSQCILRGVQRTLSLKILCQFLAARFKKEKTRPQSIT